METTARATPQARWLALITLAGFATACGDGPPPKNDKDEDPRTALFAVHGRASASAEQPLASEDQDLRAYAYWATETTSAQPPFIDEVALASGLPATFTLEVMNEPAPEERSGVLDGLAFAGLMVTTPAVVDAMRTGDSSGVSPDAPLGFARAYIIWVQDEETAARAATELKLPAPVGFSLLTISEEAYACIDEAYAVFDECAIDIEARCAALEADDPDAAEACREDGCSAEWQAAEEASAACPPTVVVLDASAELEVIVSTVEATYVE